jgi:hypothetical protein
MLPIPSLDWSAAGQDKWVGQELIRLGAVKAAGDGDFKGAMAIIAGPWVSMPGGKNANTHVTLEQAEKIYKNALATLPECNNQEENCNEA